MGAASDVVDALRDGETSDGKFWIAIAFIAGAVILLVVLICACYAWRRRKRQRALRRKLNDAVEPEGLWGTESTAPLAESRRRGSRHETDPLEDATGKRSSKGVPLVSHSSGMRTGGGTFGHTDPLVSVQRPATPPKSRANSHFISAAHEPASPPIPRYGPPLTDAPQLEVPVRGAGAPHESRRASDAAPSPSTGEPLSPRSRTAMLGAVGLPGAHAGVAHPHLLRSVDGSASPSRARSPSGARAGTSQRERSPSPLRPDGSVTPRARSVSANGARPATPPKRDFTDRIQPPLPVSPRVYKQASLPAQHALAMPQPRPLAKGGSMPGRLPEGAGGQEGEDRFEVPPLRARTRSRNFGPPAFLHMATPGLASGQSALSASQGFQLEGEMMLRNESDGDESLRGPARALPRPRAAAATSAAAPSQRQQQQQTEAEARADDAAERGLTPERGVTSPVTDDAPTLTIHLGLATLKHAHPKFADSAAMSAEELSMRLFDMGVRFWTLKRRQPAHYVIIRRLHTLTAPYVKRTVDIDVDRDLRAHPLLEKSIAVEGVEEVVYVDVSGPSGVWLEVQLEAAGVSATGRTRVAWVRLVLVEGGVVVMPQDTVYRLRMPGRGVVGIIRGIMPDE